MSTKGKCLEFFCNFLGTKTLNFIKIDQKFENKCFFKQNFMEFGMKRNFGSQSCHIWGLGPKSKFKVIWAQSLWQGTYQAISQEP